jgi:hypothetical protein
MTDRPLEGAIAEKAVPFHRTSPIDLLAYKGRLTLVSQQK